MLVITASPERTITTPAAVMTALAGPSQGSEQISTWTVEAPTDSASPAHVITRDQVWTVLAGTFAFTVGEETVEAKEGATVVLPADSVRRFTVTEGPARALVAMLPDGQAGAPGSDVRQNLPWAA